MVHLNHGLVICCCYCWTASSWESNPAECLWRNYQGVMLFNTSLHMAVRYFLQHPPGPHSCHGSRLLCWKTMKHLSFNKLGYKLFFVCFVNLPSLFNSQFVLWLILIIINHYRTKRNSPFSITQRPSESNKNQALHQSSTIDFQEISRFPFRAVSHIQSSILDQATAILINLE